MKKVFSILLTLALFALLFQFVVNVFINEHEVEYSIKTDDNTYSVRETFQNMGDNSDYSFTIVDQNQLFYTFSYNYDYNKQERIIKDIKYYNEGDIKCIFPIYKRNQSGDLVCLYQGNQVSYTYLKQMQNSSIDSIVSKVEKLGYSHASWNMKDGVAETSEDGKIQVYRDHILKDYVFTMWNYKGIYIMRKDKVLNKELLSRDLYENNYSAYVGKYYVSVDNVGFDGMISNINEFVYYNTYELGHGTIPVDEPIQGDFYYNGIYNDKLYLTNLTTKKQYSVDPTYEKVEEVGNEENGFLVVRNLKLKNIDSSEFLREKVYFNSVSNEQISSQFPNAEIKEDGNFYYFKTSDGKFYQTNKNKISKPILLFQLSNATDWKVKDEEIIAVSGDTLYFYNTSVGLRRIAVNPELIYNYKNICDFWKK